jgi:fructosamine-3-kinase
MNFDQKLIEAEISNLTNKEYRILSAQRLNGGDINEVYRLETNFGPKCIKINSSSQFPYMFEMEKKGLNELKRTNAIRVAEPIVNGTFNDSSFLLLEYVLSAQKQPDFWTRFGNQLADLHLNTQEIFGLSDHNYIGSLIQKNDPFNTWSEFFIECRLKPQIELALSKNLLTSNDLNSFERFYRVLEEVFPSEPPSLVHGDLWSGNYMVGPQGNAVLIDPAVYYGHREMDISMTMLFGGYPPSFYDGYNEQWSLEPGWKERVDYCNLYPLLVHLNLFGSAYLSSIRRIIKTF